MSALNGLSNTIGTKLSGMEWILYGILVVCLTIGLITYLRLAARPMNKQVQSAIRVMNWSAALMMLLCIIRDGIFIFKAAGIAVLFSNLIILFVAFSNS